uniref:Uncharacterized protein n=1 Tax=Pipistrellus kuhlii TaxID=59472 RepID=A0A7J7UTE5_PIPKU|nr:hypothetical protein mPipKuh1_008701 [Pipistrellus kuhlii]
MTLSLTSTMPYPGTGPVPPDSSLPPFPPWPPSGARTLELEGVVEVVQLEWRPAEFINTSLGLSLLLRPCILSSPLHHPPPISKHICTHSCIDTKTNSSAPEAVPCAPQGPLPSHSPLPRFGQAAGKALELVPLLKRQGGRRAPSPECVSRGRTVG